MSGLPVGKPGDEGGRLAVHPDRLRHNAAELRRLFGRELICVVKGDGYGLGVRTVARALADGGEKHMAVASAAECAAVLTTVSEADVMVMRPELGLDPGGVATHASIVLGWHTLGALRRQSFTGPVRVQVEVECGVGRGGIPVHELAEALAWTRDDDRVRVTGLLAHFPQVLAPGMRAQTLDLLRRAEDTIGALVSIGGSDALRWAHEAPTHWPVRVGRALYGVAPRWLAPHDLRSAWAWTCRAYPLARPGSTGYRARELAPGSPVHLGVGFAGGLPTQAADRWPILVAGRPYLIVEVFMLSSVALPVEPDAPAAGAAEALLSGESPDGAVSVRDIAAALGMPTTAILTAPRPTVRIPA